VTIAFYISGHGFGHASREIEVINAIFERQPGARVIIRSSAPDWFLNASARGPIELQPIETDTGVAQIDSLHLDEDETARQAARFYQDFDRRASEEAATLSRLRASLVVGDIPPLAFAAASQAAIRSVAVGNFTWDWIYSGYPDFRRLAPGVIERIRDAYATATRALRLPFPGGFESMAAVTRDIPLIARRARHDRDAVRRALDLDGTMPIVLSSFGGHGVQLPYDEIAARGRFTLLATDYETGTLPSRTNRLRILTAAELTACDLRYEDLVAASDVVVSKPGYGIVSECIANGAALLYTSRGRFLEHEVFVAEMPRVLRCRHIPKEDLLAGRWCEAIDALLRQPPPTEGLALNGSDVAADEILGAA
jgi:L-arabinokinase